jgi:cystathionine beta-lyase
LSSAFAILFKGTIKDTYGNPLPYATIYLRNNHELLLSFIKQIKSLKMLPLEATYLAWIQYDEEILGDFQQRLFTNGLHVLRGDQFLGKNFIRVNIACTKNSLEKALLIIKKTIDEAH